MDADLRGEILVLLIEGVFSRGSSGGWISELKYFLFVFVCVFYLCVSGDLGHGFRSSVLPRQEA